MEIGTILVASIDGVVVAVVVVVVVVRRCSCCYRCCQETPCGRSALIIAANGAKRFTASGIASSTTTIDTTFGAREDFDVSCGEFRFRRGSYTSNDRILFDQRPVIE